MTKFSPEKRDLPLLVATERFVTQFESSEGAHRPEKNDWLRRLRKDAILRFAEFGLPSTRDEEWKFTSLATFAKSSFERVRPMRVGDSIPEIFTTEQIHNLTFRNSGSQIVFVNGRYCPELSSLQSLPRGVILSSLGAMLKSFPEQIRPHLTQMSNKVSKHANVFELLNTAFFEDGVYLYLPQDAVVSDPIHLVFVSAALDSATVSYSRNLIVAKARSVATIIESYVDIGSQDGQSYFINPVTQVMADNRAFIDHYQFQHQSNKTFHIASLDLHQGQGSNVTSHSLSLGGGLVRNDVSVVFDGEGAECTLNGVYATTGSRHVDNHTVIDHAKPRCSSREFYKGILDGSSHGVFNGKIVVREDAQKSDAQQENKNLILSDGATVNTKPQLEIKADDVKCTHGATIGRLDSEALFYLRSRGIPEKTARSILTSAFASDLLSQIRVEPLRKKIETILAQMFADRSTA